jgi:DNA-binding transcriptional MerR regulator
MKHDGIRKLYYSISEVAELTDLEPHVLRYWESEFEQLHPKKNRAGNRVYTERDIETVKRVKHLLRVDKYTIEGARQVLAQDDEAVHDTTRTALRELRAFLEKLVRAS